MKKHAFHNWTV